MIRLDEIGAKTWAGSVFDDDPGLEHDAQPPAPPHTWTDHARRLLERLIAGAPR